MGRVLTKQFKHWPPGAIVTNDAEEWKSSRAGIKWALEGLGIRPGETVYVNAERMAQLEREGYFS